MRYLVLCKARAIFNMLYRDICHIRSFSIVHSLQLGTHERLGSEFFIKQTTTKKNWREIIGPAAAGSAGPVRRP